MELSALFLLALDPFNGIAKYMSWHLTEHLSALGFRQHVRWTSDLAYVPGRRLVLIFILSLCSLPLWSPGHLVSR